MSDSSLKQSNLVSLSGEIARMPAHPVIRALLTVTGLLLLRGMLFLFVRYCLGLKGSAVVSIQDNVIHMETEWTFFGKKIRRTTTACPIARIDAVRFENRQRFLYLTVGFGALTVGGLLGIQWFLDGLHAGYPYLVAAGAIVTAAGVAMDIFLYLFVPVGAGRSHLVFALGPWIVRLKGVRSDAAEQAVLSIQSAWKTAR